MRRFFVTGTDTGVGKTFVTCAITRLLRARGQRVFAFKPIETGCPLVSSLSPEGQGERLGEDQRALVEAAGGWQVGRLRGLYSLSQPLAPAVAARIDGVEIDLVAIRRLLEQGAAEADVAIVEGAGGWRVPISDTLDMSALAKLVVDQTAGVLVVARAGLGTINHSLLTIEAIERDGFEVAALVLSTRPTDDPEMARSNAEELCRRWTGPVVDVSRIETLDTFHVERR